MSDEKAKNDPIVTVTISMPQSLRDQLEEVAAVRKRARRDCTDTELRKTLPKATVSAVIADLVREHL